MQLIDIVSRQMLEPAGLSVGVLPGLLSTLMGPGIDAGDLYFQSVVREVWALEDGQVKQGGYSFDQGVGLRAISGETVGNAFSNSFSRAAIEQAAVAARAISRQGRSATHGVIRATHAPTLYTSHNPLDIWSQSFKVEFLQRLDSYARALDPRVKQVSLSLSGSWEHVLIMDSEGTLAADVRPLVRLAVTVILEQGGRMERGYFISSGRHAYSVFSEHDSNGEERALACVREALRLADLNFDAIAAPAGSLPVVMGPGQAGVLLHEAVGHGLEGDFNRKGSSNYSGRIGQTVASNLCTIVDDGTLSKQRGSLQVDDEGTPSACNVLVENGVLKGYMQDKLNARLTGQALTGNARRQSYAHMTMPRMTNTYMLAGQSHPEEIIQSVKRGIYCAGLGSGQVDITNGQFVFSTSEAYLIEGGRIVAPVKDATLIGNGPQIMCSISMVGNDLKLDPGAGVCGKQGQNLPVGVGQPTLKIDAITVGGTA